MFSLPRWVWPLALLGLVGMMPLAAPAASIPTKPTSLPELIVHLRKLENGDFTRDLTVEQAQELAQDLQDVVKEIAQSRKSNPHLKLDGVQAAVLERRAKDWGRDRDYPLLSSPENAEFKDKIRDSAIEGERFLTCVSVKAEWRWRILVKRDGRDNSKPREWIRKHALAVQAKARKDKKDPATAWADLYADTTLSEALSGVARGYNVHHRIPLYVGTENGGVDDGDPDASGEKGNFWLLSKGDHIKIHQEHGAVTEKWGPPRLYAKSKTENDQSPDPDD